MKKNNFIIFFLLIYSQGLMSQLFEKTTHEIKKDSYKSIIVSTKKIEFSSFPHAFNPSIAQTNLGLLLTFRYSPDLYHPWFSYIGIVFLDDVTLEPIGEPQLLDMHSGNCAIPSQAEDARIFSFNGNTYIIYNDSMDCVNPTSLEHRDMFISLINYQNNKFVFSKPIKLFHYYKYFQYNWQKNWSAFEWNNALLFTYSINPHEVVYPNFISGKCMPIYKTNEFINWMFGELRGGTPALLVDGEYLAFFHSSIFITSPVSKDLSRYHYFMGAYTFSAEPPFNLTKITYFPIIGEGFYNDTHAEKRVVFPGGYVVSGPYLHIAFGKDNGSFGEKEIWITTIDKERLQSVLEPLQDIKEKKEMNELIYDIFEFETNN